MNRAVIIVTHEGNKEWLKNLLSTIPLDDFIEYNVQVFHNGNPSGYELAAIHWALEQGYDEFILLQDTVEIKNCGFFDVLFNMPGSVSIGNNYFMYMGKYERKHLLDMDIPHVSSKRESIDQEIRGDGFCTRYAQKSQATVLDPMFVDRPVYVTMFGDNCMLLENSWIRKYKRVWSPEMVKE